MQNLPVEQWAGAVRLAIRQEDMYAENDELDSLLEPQESQEPQEPLEPQEPQEPQDPQDPQDPQEPPEPPIETENEIMKCSNCDYVSETPHFFQQHAKSLIGMYFSTLVR